ncbi:MAG: RDD family protein [Clostridium baratii]|uniref:RDD family protein n=2 Tax=Clostridium TaxID=1485 RepID=A0A0A7G1S2_9CLOT|nr:RDD family protein [Clostridium baratii]AIY84931.1 RDD family protein [Clostridium baratii str. Sullivan]KJU72130.1 hypothetical protein UC77_05295 [Clostridium baratii]MBS6007202.1 RDD family protein [Clostridium baratii]MBT9830514.1 RDD family protein [Clostridium baratii]MDU1054039.1 RDD family protein [Clostridium baratii]
MKIGKGKVENKSLYLRRVMATFIDWYLASVLAGIPVLLIYNLESGDSNIARSLESMSTNYALVAGTLAILVASAYYLLLPTLWRNGQTLGKRLLGIKITNLNNGEVKFKDLFKREIIGVMLVEGGIICSSEYLRQMLTIVSNINTYKVLSILASIITFISIILIFVTKENRMIHDIISKTKVIEIKNA